MWVVVQRSFFLLFPHASGRVSGLGSLQQDAVRCLGCDRQLSPAHGVMGSLEGFGSGTQRPEGLSLPSPNTSKATPDCVVSLQVLMIQQQQVGEGLAWSRGRWAGGAAAGNWGPVQAMH